MIKLIDAGQRGGTLTVEMTPFDLVALLNDESYTVRKMEADRSASREQAEAEGKPESGWDVLGLDVRLNDAKANLKELERVQSDREAALNG